jgi:hypothetical protein
MPRFTAIFNLGGPTCLAANADDYTLGVVPGCGLVVQHNVDQ